MSVFPVGYDCRVGESSTNAERVTLELSTVAEQCVRRAE